MECFTRNRYFTVASEYVQGTPGMIEERSESLAVVHNENVVDETPEYASHKVQWLSWSIPGYRSPGSDRDASRSQGSSAFSGRELKPAAHQ